MVMTGWFISALVAPKFMRADVAIGGALAGK